MDCILGVTHSLSGRAWRPRDGDARTGLALSQRFGFPEIVGRLLACRGVGEDDCERFLTPTLRDGLPDPSHLKDMDRAVERLVAAIRKGERIAIFGDYDVDGATSSALLKRFFASLDVDAIIYVPDRQREKAMARTPPRTDSASGPRREPRRHRRLRDYRRTPPCKAPPTKAST